MSAFAIVMLVVIGLGWLVILGTTIDMLTGMKGMHWWLMKTDKEYRGKEAGE